MTDAETARYALGKQIPAIEGAQAVEILTNYGSICLEGKEAAAIAKALRRIMERALKKAGD